MSLLIKRKRTNDGNNKPPRKRRKVSIKKIPKPYKNVQTIVKQLRDKGLHVEGNFYAFVPKSVQSKMRKFGARENDPTIEVTTPNTRRAIFFKKTSNKKINTTLRECGFHVHEMLLSTSTSSIINDISTPTSCLSTFKFIPNEKAICTDMRTSYGEDDFHKAIVKFIRKYYPELNLTGRAEGNLSRKYMGLSKRLGYYKGACDLSLKHMTKKYRGLEIELKVKCGKRQDNQIEYAKRMTKLGCFCSCLTLRSGTIADGVHAFHKMLIDYFQEKELISYTNIIIG